MKKTYNKPQIFFESFELSTSIAANCIEILTKEQEEEIRNEFSFDTNAFTEGTCDNEVVCYHVPNGYSNVFTS